MTTPIPDNEEQRLAVLKEYHILDTDAEELYDDITRLAAYLCKVPFSTVSLLDQSRHWLKSKVGIDHREGPRDVALFSSYAILQSQPLIVRDALKDVRFVAHPLVTRTPRLRFYAGFPLINPEGFALGALCVLDRRPRQLSARQKQAMQVLARQVMALLELRRVSSRMAHLLEKIKLLHGLLPICAWCKRIRDDSGYWQQVEGYVHEHLGADFTHGICPDCLEKQRPNKPKKEG
ncbi:MAG TPA: GAF domain-containing protein [Verrucomicrobiota bacterium]|jgi:GAF domain-containing protein|nr:GAF domain-containing protein [Verrucomicrobiota bacterium]HQL77336.1 GAF domain-containing protein [Verrucomicrobiota bacterium]